MKLTIQKRLASQILGVSPKKIVFDSSKLAEIKEAITKADIKVLIANNVIKAKQPKHTSKVRARKIALQKRKGKRRGPGKRKGKSTARLPKKKSWMNKIRLQRKFLKTLRDKDIIDNRIYQMLYKKSKGGFFRSKNHIKLYIEERKLTKENEKKS